MRTLLLPSCAALSLLVAASARAQPADSPPPPTAPLAPTAQPADSPPPAGFIAPANAPPLAGFHDGFFLRDPRDYFRLYPRARLNLDFYSSFGPGVGAVKAVDGGTAFGPRLLVRRLRLELGGDVLERLSFFTSIDFGGQPITNASGKAEQSAAKAGEAPTAGTARYAAVQAVGPAAALADTWVDLRAASFLHLMLGQYQAPFSLENRTSEGVTPFMERNVAIRGFVFPTGKEVGLSAWGDLLEQRLSYELGVFGGDGQNRPQIDGRFDFMGRVVAHPFAGGKGPLARAQIGMSAHHGDRDPSSVGYDHPQITSGQGFALWDPTYKDSLSRQVHILPSGAQNQIGGELRIPLSRVALQGEAYYVANNTREALDGRQLSNTERLGQIHGVGWYGQVSVWAAGDTYVNGEPGLTRPRKVDLQKPEEPLKMGLEVLGIVAGINAGYEGASRGGVADARTPGASAKVASKITVYQVGLGLNYWATRYVRASLNYLVYYTPGSASADNLAIVPGNLGAQPDEGAHLLQELGTRVALQF